MMKIEFTKKKQVVAGLIGLLLSQIVNYFGKTQSDPYVFNILALIVVAIVFLVVIHLRKDDKNRMPYYLFLALLSLVLVAFI